MKASFDVTPHLEDLWRYGRVLTHNDADADDLVQEALARALTLARSYDGSRPLMPWLITIVRNTFLTSAVRADAERRRLAAYAEQSDPLLLPSQEHSAELSNVRKALGELPTEQAEVLHLVGVLGFTYSDAADRARRTARNCHVTPEPRADCPETQHGKDERPRTCPVESRRRP